MAAPTLASTIATVANTTGNLAVSFGIAGEANDVNVISVIYWGPNTVGAVADIPTPTDWAPIAQLNIPAAGDADGKIAWFWIRGNVVSVTVTRGASWDTGTDTCLGAAGYIIRGCITTGDPWDEVDPTAIYTAANQAFDAVTVSGAERMVVQFGASTDNQAFAMTATGWTANTADPDATGTDCNFNTARQDNVSVSTGADATTVSAPAQGAYAYLGVSFKPPVAVPGAFNPSWVRKTVLAGGGFLGA